MAADYLPSRPLSVAIPQSTTSAPCCPRRPNLSEILNNQAQAPYTLSEFMGYLSRRHCLETLEFTMDASRYRKHYTKMVNRKPFSHDECANVKHLWRRLVDAYIAPGGNREVNLPSDCRDELLVQALGASDPPPEPSVLDVALDKVRELMEESVLVPFLNSQCQVSAQHANSSDENLHMSAQTYDQSSYYASSRSQQQLRYTAHASSVPAHSHHRASAPATYSRSLGPTTQHSRFASGPARFTSSHSYASSSEAVTDDSGSVSSPSPIDPITPPTTPPTGEHGGGGWAAELYTSGHAHTTTSAGHISSANSSPRSSRGEHASLANATANQWKRVSSKLGWGKKSGGHLREDHEHADRMED